MSYNNHDSGDPNRVRYAKKEEVIRPRLQGLPVAGLQVNNWVLAGKIPVMVTTNILSAIESGVPFYGIPLTTEWLERAGFTVNEITKSIYDIPPHGFYSIKERGGNWYFLIDLEGGSVLTDIQYVHQLQNLYHALTSQELTFKKIEG